MHFRENPDGDVYAVYEHTKMQQYVIYVGMHITYAPW